MLIEGEIMVVMRLVGGLVSLIKRRKMMGMFEFI
jgi:hypothetical protein